MKRMLVCLLATLSVAFTVSIPTHAQANCAHKPNIYWVSVPNNGEIAPNQPIFVAHTGDTEIRTTLNGELLMPAASGPYHSEYLPTTLWPTDGPQELVFKFDTLDQQNQPTVITKSFSFTASEEVSVAPGEAVSILSTSPTSIVPQTTCEELFWGTSCPEDSGPPLSFELSGEAVAYFIERPDDKVPPGRFHQLWPGECAPQLHKGYAYGCYRIVAVDGLGQRHTGPSNCDLFGSHDNESRETSNGSPWLGGNDNEPFQSGDEQSSCTLLPVNSPTHFTQFALLALGLLIRKRRNQRSTPTSPSSSSTTR